MTKTKYSRYVATVQEILQHGNPPMTLEEYDAIMVRLDSVRAYLAGIEGMYIFEPDEIVMHRAQFEIAPNHGQKESPPHVLQGRGRTESEVCPAIIHPTRRRRAKLD